MRFPGTSLGLLFALTVMVGCSRDQAQHSVIPAPSGATNGFVIHLQEGFYDSREAVITVDGFEVYRGTPKTNPVLGFAAGVSAVATSPHPVVTFTIASKGIRWSQQIDLSAGAAVGTEGAVQPTLRNGWHFRGLFYDRSRRSVIAR
jgi:hypothetical protein